MTIDVGVCSRRLMRTTRKTCREVGGRGTDVTQSSITSTDTTQPRHVPPPPYPRMSALASVI